MKFPDAGCGWWPWRSRVAYVLASLIHPQLIALADPRDLARWHRIACDDRYCPECAGYYNGP